MRAILTYHSVDPSGSPISIDEAAFRAHVAFLATGAVPVVPLAKITAPGGPEHAVALTFDDAFTSFADVAWPLLREHRMPVTVFVVSGHAGGTNAWGNREAPGIPTLPLMTWDALARAASEGASLGAHSRTHPDLRRVADDARLREELEGSASDIAARTGLKPRAFAYPYGAVDPRVAAAAAGCFDQAVTTDLRSLGTAEDPRRLPRLDAFYFRESGRLEAWGNAAFVARLAVRGALRRARALLTGRPA